MHFLVQAAAPALAPLAPHLESLTQPLTVWDFAHVVGCYHGHQQKQHGEGDTDY